MGSRSRKKEDEVTVAQAKELLDGPPEFKKKSRRPKSVPASVIENTQPLINRFNNAAEGGYDAWKSFHLEDIEMRIGLRSRLIVEDTLANGIHYGISRKDLADLALRSITTFEGSKQEIQWKDELAKRTTPRSVEIVKAERERVDARLKKLMLRRGEVKLAAAEAAFEAAKKTNGEDKHGNGSADS